MKKWIFAIRNKAAAALMLGLIVLLVLANNLGERYSMHQLSSSFDSVYEDRLLVESYIYRLSEVIHRKHYFLQQLDCGAPMPATGERLRHDRQEAEHLLSQYASTFLTEKEAGLFGHLLRDFETLEAQEASLLEDLRRGDGVHERIAALDATLNEASGILAGLSEIQLQEGKRLNDRTHQIILSRASSSRFELALLLILAIFIQALVLTSKSVAQVIRPKDVQLN
jgi:hypothetical protein